MTGQTNSWGVQDLSWTSISSGVQDLSWTSNSSGVQDLSWTSNNVSSTLNINEL
jgi:hypothetical protein